MTEELKTLKDIKRTNHARYGSWDFYKHEELKQEAIKWHKHLKEVTSEHDVWDFIETFFNITEEDLK